MINFIAGAGLFFIFSPNDQQKHIIGIIAAVFFGVVVVAWLLSKLGQPPGIRVVGADFLGGASHQAGIQVGDVVTRIGGYKVSTMENFSWVLTTLSAQHRNGIPFRVRVQFWHNGKRRNTTVALVGSRI